MTDPPPGAAEPGPDLEWLATGVAELEAALADTCAAHDANRRFLADAAHQLRTPLAGIQARAEALLRGPAAHQSSRLFTNLVRETSRLVRLETDLCTLARLDDDEQVQRRAVDLVGLCREEISRVWSLAPQLDVVLRAPTLE